ncbi:MULTISPECIES: hypothetical protein [unclassified Arcicella]|uniref:hypothetical protein n=1 Tax=unclassified Arcicella TaxID=2644986 RepID=UPI0028548A12|nr:MULTISPECIES: hypothetical protein [unclassified Arcicella]MDR6564951.1 hypothetical protein [Arcicella sp. BE51]MDR6814741.1 hypothetical protein [Arcicella sp. BE140]MDR6826187.1 hypothetical protein [Arcicella sp. BE139]
MVTIQESKSYPLVKSSSSIGTKAWAKGTQDGFIYRLSTIVNTYKTGTTLGVLTKAYSIKSGNSFGVVQLLKPITKGLTKYTHVLVLLADISTVAETEAPKGNLYFCSATNVNIRVSPSKLSAKLPSQLTKGEPIGYSDGIVQNGFLMFKLRSGGVGYVSKTYCTLQEPSLVTIPVTKANPLTGKDETQDVPVIDNPKGTLDIWKTALGAGISAVVVFVASKIFNKIF